VGRQKWYWLCQARVLTGGSPPGLTRLGAASPFPSSQLHSPALAAPRPTRPGTRAQVYRPPSADRWRVQLWGALPPVASVPATANKHGWC
jgi:hypothetical protein